MSAISPRYPAFDTKIAQKPVSQEAELFRIISRYLPSKEALNLALDSSLLKHLSGSHSFKRIATVDSASTLLEKYGWTFAEVVYVNKDLQPSYSHVFSLDLSKSARNDDELISILKRFPKIQSLDLSDSENITDKGLQWIAENCLQLRHLNLNNCTKVSSKGILALIENCVHLESFDFSLETVTETVIITISKSLHRLKILKITCFHFTEKAVRVIGEILTNLLLLEVYASEECTDQDKAVLEKHYPNCLGMII